MDKIVGLITNWILHKATQEQLIQVDSVLKTKLEKNDTIVIKGYIVHKGIIDLIKSGQALASVKQIKEETGWSLADAKHVYDLTKEIIKARETLNQ